MKTDVKRLLRSINRTTRKYPGMQLMGPTGARLWADMLENTAGFSGRLDFIHKLNLPLLFRVCPEGADERLPLAVNEWYPDESILSFRDDRLLLRERKTITYDDVAVSCQSWMNLTDKPVQLVLTLPEGMSKDEIYTFPVNLHGLIVKMSFKASSDFAGGFYTLKPREKRMFLFAAALGLEGEEDTIKQKAASLVSRAGEAEELMNELSRKYLSWFDDAPEFECSDKYIEKCWWYRWYILRSCLAEPGTGYLNHALFYEGRAHAMEKTPYQATGWEFSRLIPLSTPLTLTDARWFKNPEIAKEAFRALGGTMNDDGAFSVSSVDSKGKEYSQYAAWALYSFYLLDGDREFIREVLPMFKKDALSVYARHKGANDDLQICYTHALTGKEYQPGYWFFTNQCFPPKVRGTTEGYTPLKRVDCSVYMYLNFTGLGRLCREVGDADAEMFLSKAESIKNAVLGKMWEGVSGCFYDLHHQTDRRAYVKHIVSVYPLWAGMTDGRHLKMLDYLFSPDYFARGSGFASAAADCPVYSPSGGWKGDYFKGRDGCMWNGPSWPYTTGIALDATAKQSKQHAHAYDAQFMKFFRQYTLEHFRGGNIDDPYLVEFYNAETGEALSDEADYNHSFYIDLVVRHIAGIEPTEKGFCFHPLKTGLGGFSLKGVNIQGHSVDVVCEAKESGGQALYRVCVDGRERLSVNDIDQYVNDPVTIDLNEGD